MTNLTLDPLEQPCILSNEQQLLNILTLVQTQPGTGLLGKRCKPELAQKFIQT